jgi:hypothetical protein
MPAYIGWQSTVQSRHFASLKHTAMNARTPRADPPHPFEPVTLGSTLFESPAADQAHA